MTKYYKIGSIVEVIKISDDMVVDQPNIKLGLIGEVTNHFFFDDIPSYVVQFDDFEGYLNNDEIELCCTRELLLFMCNNIKEINAVSTRDNCGDYRINLYNDGAYLGTFIIQEQDSLLRLWYSPKGYDYFYLGEFNSIDLRVKIFDYIDKYVKGIIGKC